MPKTTQLTLTLESKPGVLAKISQALAGAGLDYYNHNLDTSPEFYTSIITTRTYGERLASFLVRQRILTEKFAVTYLGRQLGVPHVDLSKTEIDLSHLDVLSLDVALPAALRARVPAFEDMDVVLKRHPHTPAWALEACAAKGIAVVDSIARLPALLRV
jgi:hypothetical protein